MAENRQRHDEPEVRQPDLEQPENRYEHVDVDAWAIGKFAIALVLLCGVALLLLAGVFKFLLSRETAGPQPPTGINVDARRLPPQPRLQYAPVLDLEEFRAAEEKILNSYGWVDRQNGVVRMPIGRAMDLLAQRGLPARTAAPPPASTATVPTEAGLGYIMQQPGGPLAGTNQPPQAPNPPVKSSEEQGKFLPKPSPGEEKK